MYILFSVTALSALVSFVTGIWLRNILGPEEYGVWLVFAMILTYGYYLNLGILDGFSRDVPRLLGEKKTKSVQQVRNVVFTWLLSSAVIVILAAIIILLLPLSRVETILSICAVLLIPLQNMALFHNHLFLTTQQFSVVAVIQLLIGSVQYLLMTVFALKGGIYGLFLGMFIGNILAISYARFKVTYRISIEWDWKVFREMLSYGLPITLIGLLFSALTTLDRLMAFLFLGPVSAGHYGMTFFVYQAIMVLPGVFYQVMYPKINFHYGQTGQKKALKTLLLHPTIYISYMSPFLIGPLYFIFPVFTEIFMPDYADGVKAAQIVMMGLFFVMWGPLYSQYLMVVNKQWIYFKILLSTVFAQALLTITFIKMGFHIEGVAYGTVISYIVYPLAMMWCCFKDMGEKTISFLKYAVLVTGPFLVMIALILIVQQFDQHVSVKMCTYILFYFLFLVMSTRYTPILSILQKMMTFIKR